MPVKKCMQCSEPSVVSASLKQQGGDADGLIEHKMQKLITAHSERSRPWENADRIRIL